MTESETKGTTVMITRLSAGFLAASALVLTPCLAAPPAPAPVRTISTSYTINHSNTLVTIKSESGKLLLTLEDATGLRLWSAPVPTGHGMHSAKFTWKAIDGVSGGMKFTFAFSAKSQPGAMESTPDSIPAEGPVVTYVIGAGNNIVSVNGEGKNDQINIATVPNGATLTTSDGTNAAFHMTSAGDTVEFNGTKIKMEPVKRDGKDYFSFPWNGHKIFVEGGCTISLTGDGDLTVDGPAKTAKK